jgi:DNA-binding transcriptional LysR family regulator
VRQLEEHLGTVLLDRSRRPLGLTAAGLTLFNRARLLLADGAQIRSAVQEAARGIAPEVTIGLVDSFAAACGPEFIRQILKKTVRLSVRSGLTPFHGEKLFAREFDMVITSDTFEAMERATYKRLYAESYVVLTPKRGGPRRFNREDLRKLAQSAPLIRFNASSHLGSQVETLLRRSGIRASSRLEVDTADTIVAMVSAGAGWALATPTCIAQGEQFMPSVQVGLLSGIHDTRSLYLAGREGEHEKLFETCHEAAMIAINNALLPALRRIAPQAVDLIDLSPQEAD